MITIRLSRTGKRHKPQYRIVVQEKHRDPWSPALEVLGTYNPHTSPSTIELKEERIKHWLENGAQPSESVQNMFINAGLMEAEKAKSVTISKKRSAKLEEKKANDKAKSAEAAEAKKAEAEAKVAEEAAAKEEAAKEEAAPEVETVPEETKEETPAEEVKEESAPEAKAEEAAPAEEEKKEKSAE